MRKYRIKKMIASKKTYKAILISILILFLALPSFSAENKKQPFNVSLQLNWKYQFEFAGFIAAKELGFYKQEGLNVKLKELKNPDSDIVDDVLKEKSDFGIVGSYLIYRAAKGAKVKALIPILQHSPTVLMVLKSSGINKLKQLNGKKISIANRYVFVRAMLKSNGVKYIKYPPAYSLKELIDKKIDAMTVYISNEPFIAKEKGIAVKIFKPSDYGFDGYGNILFTSIEFSKSHPEIVKKFKKATIKGWIYAFKHTAKIVNIIYKKYNTLNKTKKDLFFEASIIRKLSGYDNGNFAKFDLFRIKSIAQIYQYVMPGKYQMHNLEDFTYNANRLTKSEIYYLLKKRYIKVCVFPDFYPLEAIKNGNYIGVTSVIIDKLKQKLPIPIKIITAKTNKGVVEKTINRQCDIKSLVFANYAKCSKRLYIIPYMKDYFVVITSIDKPYLKSLDYFRNKVFVVMRKGFKNYFKEHYPYLNVKFENNMDKILKEMKENKIYGLIVPSVVANIIVKRFGYKDIKVNAKVYGSSLVFGLGVQKTEPELYKIIKKIFSGISKNNLDKLLTFYDLKEYRQKKYNKYISFIAIILAVLTAVSLLLFYIYKMKNIQLQQLLDSSISGIAVFKNDKLTMCNKPALSIMGYNSIDEIKGKKITEFVAEEDQGKLKEAMSQKRTQPYEIYLIKKDKTKLPTLSMGTRINKNTRIVSFIDLTDIKEAQNRLEELNATLEERIKQEVEKSRQQQLILLQQARYSQMGEVISMIAHQWRQPLNILSVLLQKLQIKQQLGVLDDETLEDVLNKSNNQIKQMSYIIDEFRNFFKPNQEIKKFNVSQAIDEVISTLKPLFIDLNIDVKLDLNKDIELEGYKNEFKQALMNIINNSKDALKDKEGERNIIISLKDGGEKIIVTVEDNGGGIPEDILGNVFEPYFSTKSKDGTGIGLYITKIIIEKHMHGKVSVKNTKEGAIFTITAPKTFN